MTSEKVMRHQIKAKINPHVRSQFKTNISQKKLSNAKYLKL